MFGLFKKGSDAEDNVAESEDVTTHYEGGVMSADYVAETLDRSDINEQSYPYHMLVPQAKVRFFTSQVIWLLSIMQVNSRI